MSHNQEWWRVSAIPATWEAEIGVLQIQGQTLKFTKILSQNSKRAGDAPRCQGAPGSMFSATKTKQNKKHTAFIRPFYGSFSVGRHYACHILIPCYRNNSHIHVFYYYCRGIIVILIY